MSSKSPPFGRSDRRPQVRYSPALGKLICEKIAAGRSEASLGREPGMPSVQAIYKWRNREPEFAQAYERRAIMRGVSGGSATGRRMRTGAGARRCGRARTGAAGGCRPIATNWAG